MNLRCRGPRGQFTLTGLEPSSSVASLQQRVAEETGISIERQEILLGFPPKPLKVDAVTLLGAELSHGDTLVVRESAAPLTAQASIQAASQAESIQSGSQLLSEDEQLAKALAASLEDIRPPAGTSSAGMGVSAAAKPSESKPPVTQQQGAPTAVSLADGSAVVRRIIDSDNSCLFNAVGYVMEHSRNCSVRLRRVIADTVAADPDTYTEGFLGKANGEYQKWIQDSQKWGGAIELSILSRHYGREIAAFDIQTQRVDVYGQGDGYSERAMVIYDGLHYDALAQAAFEDAPEDLDVTIFETGRSEMPAVHRAAKELVAKAHAARQFTDTASFTLRCGVCQIGVRGEKEAVQHAKETGHQNFAEYH